MTLPPILYWSASLADHFNAVDGEDVKHGLIDATGNTIHYTWTNDSWSVLRGMPDDAVRLVLEAVAS